MINREEVFQWLLENKDHIRISAKVYVCDDGYGEPIYETQEQFAESISMEDGNIIIKSE